MSTRTMLATGRLTINVDRAAVGSNERLIFTANFASDTAGKAIQLWQSTTPGALTTLIFPLVDDGSYTYRDAVAGDGVFSNTKSSADCSVEGDVYYTAVITGQPAPAEVLTAKLHCFTPATPPQVDSSIAQATSINTQLLQKVAQGNTVPQALAAIANTLNTTPGVDPATVKTTGASVRWRTLQGLRFRAYVPLPGQRAGPALPAKGYVQGPSYAPPGWVDPVTAITPHDHLPRPLAAAAVSAAAAPLTGKSIGSSNRMLCCRCFRCQGTSPDDSPTILVSAVTAVRDDVNLSQARDGMLTP